jgi:hypothetical protein
MTYRYYREFRIGRRADTLYKRINKAVRKWYEGNVQEGVRYTTEPEMRLSDDKKYIIVECVMSGVVVE